MFERPRHPLRALLPAGVAVAVAVAAMAGCGTGDDRDQVRDVVAGFHAALDEGRAADACALLAPPTVDQLESQESAPCAEAVTKLDLRGGAIDAVDVAIVDAKVDLDGGQSAFLGREADGWRISALGCTPVGGKPADRPYDCEVQA